MWGITKVSKSVCSQQDLAVGRWEGGRENKQDINYCNCDYILKTNIRQNKIRKSTLKSHTK